MSPTTEPENWWPFREGETQVVGLGWLELRVDHIFERRVLATMTLRGQKISEALLLGEPMALCRDAQTSAVLVAATLRRVDGGVAYLQVSHHTGLSKTMERSDIQ